MVRRAHHERETRAHHERERRVHHEREKRAHHERERRVHHEREKRAHHEREKRACSPSGLGYAKLSSCCERVPPRKEDQPTGFLADCPVCTI